jgi:ABC-type bacteriocin/lantibiotic exporter with double-glycine peptidase domain
LIQLLLGFYPPTKGAIYYEEQDSSGLDMRQIRQQMGVVLQQDALFGGSLWDNITCGRSYTYEEVMATVRLVGLEEDLARLPMGIHTLLAAGSGSLSGGQKQKIYIARALIGRPKMLILDEATSACDSRSCETIAENLQNLDITRIIVTHRLKSLKNADRIYVMNQGKIVDEGRFDDLASRPGLFSRLLQA